MNKKTSVDWQEPMVMRFNLAQSSLIEASAGTGKTYTITKLILRILLGSGNDNTSLARPLRLSDILVVTFTEAATADLKQRIFQSIHEARRDFENFLAFIIHSELKRRLLLEPNNQQMQDMLFQDNNGLLHNFSDKELKEISMRISLDKIRQSSESLRNCDDTNFLLITELAQRDISLVRQAIGVLQQAERDIDIAPICTIHSFCNKALTQAFALEAGEAFQNKLQLELDDATQEVVTAVWRKIFYKKRYPRLISCLLAGKSPKLDYSNTTNSFVSSLKHITAVRKSSVDQGIAGYIFSNLACLVKKISGGCKLSALNKECLFLNSYNQMVKGTDAQDANKIKSKVSLNKFNEDQKLLQTPCVQGVLPDLKFIELSQKATIRQDVDLSLQKSLEEQYVRFLNSLVKYAYSADMSEVFAAYNELLLVIEKYMRQFIVDIYSLQGEDQAKIDEVQHFFGLIDNNEWNTKDKSSPLSIIDSQFTSKDGAPELDDNSKLWIEINDLLYAKYDTKKASAEEKDKRYQLSCCGYLFNTTLCMLFNYALDQYTTEQHVISANDLLRRLDYALNHRGELSNNLATLIRSRYPLAMIDEFQDTDPIQFNIFEKLYLNKVAKEQKAYCYLIGDPKQSIYAFRGSDINSYLKAKEAISLLNHNAIYTLDTNYRSSPDIVEGTNALFSLSLANTKGNAFQERNIYFEEVKPGKGSLESYKKPNFKINFNQDGSLLNIDSILAPGDPALQATLNQSAIKEDEPKINDALINNICQQASVEHMANNYFIAYKHKDKLTNSTFVDHAARICAFMIKKVLVDGKIKVGAEYRNVKPSDIAILVRKKAENDKIVAELTGLGIQSVYLSDASLVVQATDECNCLINLMEAMCDPTNQHKLLVVFGSQLLSFNAEEFKLAMKDSFLEKEIVLLKECAKIWKDYGFVSAFEYWANNKIHLVSRRLLGQVGGERFYTNVQHLCEIIQTKHGEISDNQAQLRWFKELIQNNSEDFESNFLQKRLESEQELVRVLTIHKSKGLEFPIVFIPFLWVYLKYASNSFDVDANLNVVKFYDRNFKSPALGDQATFFNQYLQDSLKENMRLAYVAITRARYANFFVIGNLSPQMTNLYPHSLISLFDAENYKNGAAAKAAKDKKGNKKKDSSSEDLVISTNVKINGCSVDYDPTHYAQTTKEQAPLIVGPDKVNIATFEQVLAKLKAHPKLFTILNGNRCIELYQSALDGAEQVRKHSLSLLKEDILGTDFSDESLNMSRVYDSASLPECAVSFLYQNAIDEKFYVHSYSSITAFASYNKVKAKPEEFEIEDVSEKDNFLTTKVTGSLGNLDNDYLGSLIERLRRQESTAQGLVDQDGNPISTIGMSPEELDLLLSSLEHKQDPVSESQEVASNRHMPLVTYGSWALTFQDLLDGTEFNGSAYLQSKWDRGLYPDYFDFKFTAYPGFAFAFPKGKNPGTFLHKVLQLREFENMRTIGFSGELLNNVFNFQDQDYSLANALKKFAEDSNFLLDINERHHHFAYWLNDILEAPIIPNNNTYFALSDLNKSDYVPEMKFFMRNNNFNVQDLNQICLDLANELLPPEKHELLETLSLGKEEIIGFFTGSIDLCCRFDVAHKPKIVSRLLTQPCFRDICNKVKQLVDCNSQEDIINLALRYLNSNENIALVKDQIDCGVKFEEIWRAVSNKLTILHNEYLFEQSTQVPPHYKYYVIDYKSNDLGSDYSDYNEENMLEAIYHHRYDVQFLIYSLALYRYLKRRFAIDDNFEGLNKKECTQKYEELKAFYEQHIGGVTYLFLRGLRTDYMRRDLSKGAFNIHLDFKYIWRLDQLFAVESSREEA